MGISAFYHDAAAALVIDGNIVAAAQEERFTRKKHDDSFPTYAIEYCLNAIGLSPEKLDYVGFYDKPLLKFDRLLETYLSYAPWGFQSFRQAMPVWLHEKLHLPRVLKKGLHRAYHKRFIFTKHHESHAASAFFPSPFEEAAILTLDGVGEWATATYGFGRGNKVTLVLHRTGSWPLATVVWSVTLLLSAFYYVIPTAQPLVFQTWMTLVYPIGWIISHALLVVLFFMACSHRLGGSYGCVGMTACRGNWIAPPAPTGLRTIPRIPSVISSSSDIRKVTNDGEVGQSRRLCAVGRAGASRSGAGTVGLAPLQQEMVAFTSCGAITVRQLFGFSLRYCYCPVYLHAFLTRL